MNSFPQHRLCEAVTCRRLHSFTQQMRTSVAATHTGVSAVAVTRRALLAAAVCDIPSSTEPVVLPAQALGPVQRGLPSLRGQSPKAAAHSGS